MDGESRAAAVAAFKAEFPKLNTVALAALEADPPRVMGQWLLNWKAVTA